MFNTFAHSCLLSLHTKEEQAEAIMWFCQKDTGNPEISLATINQYFEAACLPKLNVTRAKTSFAKSKNVERVRNITAHNGFLPNSEDFQRVILSFKDWCRQTTNIQ